MKRVSIYIRVSTQEQAKEGYSISAQRDKLTAFSRARDWIIDDVYIDDGYTGTNLKRPALKGLLENISNTDVVLVYKLDRLSRSQRDVLYLVEEKFLENDVDFVSLMESFDTTTPFGRAILGILAVFAQLERDTILERSRLGKERRAKDGKWRGGPLPLGYDYINGKLIINEYEASIIRQIFDKYISGSGMDSIARHLNSTGFKSKRNGKFTASKVKVYLSNPIYAGLTPYKDTTFTGEHKAIIDIDTFNLAKSILENRRTSSIRALDALLGGLLICGECGAKMFMRKIRSYRYYTCYTYHGSPSHMMTSESCNIGYINSIKLESKIIAHLNYLKDDDQAINLLIPKVLKSENAPPDKKVLKGLKKELSDINKEITRWYDAYGAGHMDLNEIDNRISAALQKKRNIEALLSSISKSNSEFQGSHVDISNLKRKAKDFSLIWENATTQERKIILNGFIKTIIVYKGKDPVVELNL